MPQVHCAAELSVNKEVLQLCVNRVPMEPYPGEGTPVASFRAASGASAEDPPPDATAKAGNAGPSSPPEEGRADLKQNRAPCLDEVWIAARCSYQVQILRARAQPTQRGKLHW